MPMVMVMVMVMLMVLLMMISIAKTNMSVIDHNNEEITLSLLVLLLCPIFIFHSEYMTVSPWVLLLCPIFVSLIENCILAQVNILACLSQQEQRTWSSQWKPKLRRLPRLSPVAKFLLLFQRLQEPLLLTSWPRASFCTCFSLGRSSRHIVWWDCFFFWSFSLQLGTMLLTINSSLRHH